MGLCMRRNSTSTTTFEKSGAKSSTFEKSGAKFCPYFVHILPTRCNGFGSTFYKGGFYKGGKGGTSSVIYNPVAVSRIGYLGIYS